MRIVFIIVIMMIVMSVGTIASDEQEVLFSDDFSGNTWDIADWNVLYDKEISHVSGGIAHMRTTIDGVGQVIVSRRKDFNGRMNLVFEARLIATTDAGESRDNTWGFGGPGYPCEYIGVYFHAGKHGLVAECVKNKEDTNSVIIYNANDYSKLLRMQNYKIIWTIGKAEFYVDEGDGYQLKAVIKSGLPDVSLPVVLRNELMMLDIDWVKVKTAQVESEKDSLSSSPSTIAMLHKLSNKKLLFSFESEAEIKQWTPDSGVNVEPSKEFTTDNNYSMKVTVQPSLWNGVSHTFFLTELGEYQNLEFDILASTELDEIAVTMSFQFYVFTLEEFAKGEKRHVVIPIGDMDRIESAVTVIFKIVVANNKPVIFHIDNLTLTNSKEGEKIRNSITLIGKRIQEIEKLPESSVLLAKAKSLENEMSQSLNTGDVDSSTLLSFQKKMDEIAKEFACKKAKGSDYIIGIESSMRKVKKDNRIDQFEGLLSPEEVSISMSRNEYESAQLIIFPLEKDLENVRVEITDLKGSQGRILSRENIELHIVEEVEIGGSDFGVERGLKGRWPDPLLDYKPFSVKKGELQSVWLTVYAPEDLPAGTYYGQIEINPSNSQKYDLKLVIKVWDFNLPKTSSLKTLFGLHSYPLVNFYGYNKYPEGWGLAGSGVGIWGNREFKDIPISKIKEWLDFFGKYRIGAGSCLIWGMYEKVYWPIKEHKDGKLDFSQWDEIVGYALNNKTNALQVMAVPTFGEVPNPAENKEYTPKLKNYLIQMQSHLEEKNWTKYSYWYLPDEPRWEILGAQFLEVDRLVKETAPGVKTMVTTAPPLLHPKYNELLKYVDAWVPLLNYYPIRLAEELRKSGKEVWWYLCVANLHPYPNFFIHYPALYSRIIPWMSWKYNVDGFLYWGLNVWGDSNISPTFKEKWPEKEWSFEKYPFAPGDGYLVYPSPNGKLWSSIRLENFRDGMEDYEYLHLLRNKAKELQEKDSKILQQAQKLLLIDEKIVKTPFNYTHASEDILKYREEIARLIEEIESILKK